MTAFAPIVKPTVLEYLSQPNFVASKLLPLFLGDPTQLGAARINPNSGDPAYAASVKNALYLDLNDKVIRATSNMLTPDEPLHGLLDTATVTAEHWGSVPRSFIRCINDQAIPLAGQNQMIAEGDKLTPRNPFMLKTLESSHSAFLGHPKEVARVLLEMI